MTILEIHGEKFVFPDNLSDEVRLAIEDGRYDGDEVTAIRKYIDSGDVIEIGGGFGVTTRIIELNTDGRILTLEPQNSVIDYLQHNIDGSRTCITANAYSPLEKPQVHMQIYDAEYSATTDKWDKNRAVIDTIPVGTVNLEDIMRRYNVDKFSLVCDAEGAEYLLLKHEADILREKCEIAIIEFHQELGGKPHPLIKRCGFEIIDRIGDVFIISPSGSK